ncbi:MAG: UvrB/UvrC motif-containing protein [Phycisphaerales bacterium]|nr:UvrB/UvrC motif-containing protein [Phycisphaerales bacterium]
MNHDLSPLLEEWPFEPGSINVRIIQGDNQEPKIQVRLDLGIIQMTTEGRPDGKRPHGFASLLEYFEHQIDESQMLTPDSESFDDQEIAGGEQEAEAFDKSENQPADHFKLSGDDCQALREEAAQYYHRYVALLVLEDYEGVIRDTSRNLRVADLCRDYAEEQSDRTVLEQVRPYILMMRARACASQALKDDEPKAAVLAVEEGLEALRQHFDNIGEPKEFEESREAEMLRAMREALVPKLPVSQRAELRERLQEAINRENYELAAILRNELRMLGD